MRSVPPVITWIERTYHRRRRQARLGRLTPIEYETIMTPQTAPAAGLPTSHLTSTRGSPHRCGGLLASAASYG